MTFAEIGLTILQAFWFIAPAYAANAFPPLMRGKKPIDRGKNFFGNRLLGNGKTKEGTIGGIAFGIFIGLVQMYFQPVIPGNLGLIEMSMPLILCLSFGAIFGDIIGSFVKRRFGIKRGDSVPLLDQLDFLVMAIALSFLVVDVATTYILILLILTPIIHYIASILGYILKIKKVPY